MTRKKPLPYFANRKLDEIRMDATSINRLLKPLMQHGDLEVVQRVGLAMNKAWEILSSTDEIKKISKNNREEK